MIDESYAESLHKLRKGITQALREVRLTSLRPGISHEPLIPLASYAPWVDDPAFRALYEKIRSCTLVDIYRCFELWDLSIQQSTLPGDVLEVGVWKGGTAAILGHIGAGPALSHLWLADTFGKGVPKAGVQDTLYQGGEHADTSEESVSALLQELGIANFTLLRGIFPDETGKEVEDLKIKLCHIDVDTYHSAWDVFSWVWSRMIPGGVIVFDDYGFWGCEGVTAAVNEMKSRGIPVVYNLNGHALVYRTSRD